MSDVVTKPRFDLKTLFVPVIFGNGVDDDTTGLQAAVANEAVQYEDRIYAPGTDMLIARKRLLVRFGAGGFGGGRHISFVSCHFQRLD